MPNSPNSEQTDHTAQKILSTYNFKIYSQLKTKQTTNLINMVQLKPPSIVINPSLNQNEKVTL